MDIRQGEVLLLATDLTRTGLLARRKEGGFDIDLFINSFQHRLGKAGTIVIPAYNFNLRSDSSWDMKKSLPATGALSIAAFHRKDFRRTAHPLHSFLVWGKYSDELCLLNNISSFGKDSPFAFLLGHNARMIFIDAKISEAFTFVHYTEEMEQVFYRSERRYNIHYTNDKGESLEKHFYLYSKKPGWTMTLEKLEKLFDERNITKKISVNGLECNSLLLKDTYPLLVDDIRSNKARNIAIFSMKLYMKDILKPFLSKAGIYRTTAAKIADDPGL